MVPGNRKQSGAGPQLVRRQKWKPSIALEEAVRSGILGLLLLWGLMRTLVVLMIKSLYCTCLSFSSNKSPYKEGEILCVLTALRNLGFKSSNAEEFSAPRIVYFFQLITTSQPQTK